MKNAQGTSPVARKANMIADKFCMNCNEKLPKFHESWYCENCPKCKTCNKVKVEKRFQECASCAGASG